MYPPQGPAVSTQCSRAADVARWLTINLRWLAARWAVSLAASLSKVGRVSRGSRLLRVTWLRTKVVLLSVKTVAVEKVTPVVRQPVDVDRHSKAKVVAVVVSNSSRVLATCLQPRLPLNLLLLLLPLLHPRVQATSQHSWLQCHPSNRRCCSANASSHSSTSTLRCRTRPGRSLACCLTWTPMSCCT